MWTSTTFVMAFLGIVSVLIIGRLTKNILIEALKDTLIVGIIIGTLIWMTGHFYPEDPQQFFDAALLNFLEIYHLYKIPMGVFARPILFVFADKVAAWQNNGV